MELKTIEDFKWDKNCLGFPGEDRNHSIAQNEVIDELRQEAIKWIKSKLEYLSCQESCFRIEEINKTKKRIRFSGLTPNGTDLEEINKGWIMGLICFFNITYDDLK